MGGHDHGLALVAEILQDAEDGVLRRGIHTTHRLVEEEEVGILGQDPCQENPLQLTAGKLPHMVLRMVEEIHALQRLPHSYPILGPRAASPTDARITAHHDDIGHAHRKVAVDVVELRQIAHHGSLTVGVGLMHEDVSRKHRDEAEDRLEQRTLASPVGADDAHHLARGDGEGDALNRWPAIITGRDVAHFQTVFPADIAMWHGCLPALTPLSCDVPGSSAWRFGSTDGRGTVRGPRLRLTLGALAEKVHAVAVNTKTSTAGKNPSQTIRPAVRELHHASAGVTHEVVAVAVRNRRVMSVPVVQVDVLDEPQPGEEIHSAVDAGQANPRRDLHRPLMHLGHLQVLRCPFQDLKDGSACTSEPDPLSLEGHVKRLMYHALNST